MLNYLKIFNKSLQIFCNMLRRFSTQLIKKQPSIPQPTGEILKRTAIIFKPAKTAMQSGIENTKYWRLKFDTQEKTENPLIGWTSSSDPIQALRLKFNTEDEAVQFCIKNGWDYQVSFPKTRKWKMKAYADNFKYSFGPLRQIKTK
eukprot:NODE_39_length_35218_cov_0.479655.p33 type:complete len:146 gc:universal NODE_39_length_35218_cov_0.479655:22921-23358(+)